MFQKRIHKLLFVLVFILISTFGSAQLLVTEENNATALAQKLVGDGVIISNATLTVSPNIIPTGIFYNRGGTNIGIDSGIVITCGRAKSNFLQNVYGVDGNGTFPASAHRADANLGLPGDATLATELGIPVSQLNDAIALEFDFVPLGDSIRFNYIMSSEEYTPSTVCVFNDAFGFFISGPGIIGNKNIAFIPGTSTPVTITNVNNITAASCVNNPQYYIDNTSNIYFVHEGHTTVFTASSGVQPCQTYHLKLVIADRGDHAWDSGVFLEAKSLSSNAIGMTNLTQTDNQGNSYLVEGCATGAFNIRRPRRDPVPLSVSLSYGGTAINGVDVQLLPTSVTIPANDSFVTVNVIPIVDNLPEGIETLKIFALAGCASGNPTDSTVIQIRDYDTLAITPQVANICKRSPILLQASTGYSFYQWDPDPTLSNLSIRNPIATPVNPATTYICSAVEGTCHARDSVHLRWKDLEFISKLDVNCHNAATGSIKVAGGSEWLQPVQFSINGSPWQTDSSFYNLPAGAYTVRIRDINCMDSMIVNITQAFPDLVISNTTETPASCSGAPDGSITLSAAGGSNVYQYSIDGVNFQGNNLFSVAAGNYTVTIKDNNGCAVSQNVVIPLNNFVAIDAGADTSICEGTSYIILGLSNANGFTWSPAATLNNPTTLSPIASPSITTMYYVIATSGLCSRTDSIRINVKPAPVANAGSDTEVCFGKTFHLTGSGGLSYQWSPSNYFISPTNIASPLVKATSNITYYLSVKDASGCQSVYSDPMQVKVTPAVKIFAGMDTVAAIGQSIQLHVAELSNAGVTRFSWTPGNFLNDPTIASPIANLPYDTRYIVTGITPDGCEGSDDIVIKVYKGPDIYVPSGFSPNHDGLNDILKAIPVGIKEFHFFRVFNRWGELMFSTPDPARGWDGRFKGVDQQTASFVWMAEAVDYKGNLVSRRGVVTIIR